MQTEIKKAGKVIPINALVATRKIRKFLNAKEPELVLFLQTLWNNQQKAITYKELREAILDGVLTAALMEEWYQDYSRFVIEKVAPMWQDAMKEANKSFSEVLGDKYIFNPMQENVVKWTNDRAAAFVTNVTRDQVQAMREIIKRASQINDMNVDELSRAIRPMVGLDWRQAIANENYYTKMIENGVKPKVALDKSIRYSARQNRYRAYRIARTELSHAYNYGAYAGSKQAQAQGLLGKCVKVWCTADDERVCDICGQLEGTEIGMDDDFYYKNQHGNQTRINPKLSDPIMGRIGTAHPGCRCTVKYKEIEPPIQAVTTPIIIQE